MKNTFRILSVLALSLVVFSCTTHRMTLNEWTRTAQDYSFENLEMKMSWYATYVGPEFRKSRAAKLAKFEDWTPLEKRTQELKDQAELAQYDEFFVSIYAGSSVWAEYGKDTGHWRLALAVGDQLVEPVEFERIQTRHQDRLIYPYLDRWSKAFRVRFPKTIRTGEPFTLRMRGNPTKSELVWK